MLINQIKDLRVEDYGPIKLNSLLLVYNYNSAISKKPLKNQKMINAIEIINKSPKNNLFILVKLIQLIFLANTILEN